MIRNVDYFSMKGDNRLNEDAVVLNHQARIYGVLDGATSLFPFVNARMETGGYIASQIIKHELERLPEGTDLKGAVLQANRRLKEEMEKYQIDTSKKELLWACASAVVRIHPYSIDYVQTGDCMIFAFYADGGVRPLTGSQLSHIDSLTLAKWKEGMARGLTDRQELRAYVRDVIRAARQKSNTLQGYSVLNGEPEAGLFMESGTISRIQLQSLLMVSDGIYSPEHRGEDDYWHKLARAVRTAGVREYALKLCEFEERDPHGDKHLRLKKSDDKTGLLIDLDGDFDPHKEA